MKVPRLLPEPLAAIPFTLREAADAGITQRQLRHQGLQRPTRGMRVPKADDVAGQGLTRNIRPYTLITKFAAASHATAFQLWGFPGFLPGSDEPLIHISRPDTTAIMRRPGVRGHRGQFFADEIVELDGLFITSRTRTWLDCARKMTIEIVKDIAREEDFARAGWTLVRISKLHMEYEARAAVSKVRSALVSRGWSNK